MASTPYKRAAPTVRGHACAGARPQRVARARVRLEGLARLWCPQDGCRPTFTWSTKRGSATNLVSIAMCDPVDAVRRSAAARRVNAMGHGPMGHGPWLIDLGRLGKGQVVGKKGCGKLRTTKSRRRARVAVLCVSVSAARLCVCLCLFVRSCICLCVCLLFHVCVCFLHARARVRLCI